MTRPKLYSTDEERKQAQRDASKRYKARKREEILEYHKKYNEENKVKNNEIMREYAREKRRKLKNQKEFEKNNLNIEKLI